MEIYKLRLKSVPVGGAATSVLRSESMAGSTASFLSVGFVQYGDGGFTQAAVLQTQLDALNLETLQARASVDLIRALGGGWEDTVKALPGTPMAMNGNGDRSEVRAAYYNTASLLNASKVLR